MSGGKNFQCLGGSGAQVRLGVENVLKKWNASEASCSKAVVAGAEA